MNRVLTLALNGICAILGRTDAARLGRAISRAARLDVINNMATNGELIVIRTLLQSQSAVAPVVFDCGANVGDYVKAVSNYAAQFQRPVELHAFEPSRQTFLALQHNVQNIRGANVVLNRVALSD